MARNDHLPLIWRMRGRIQSVFVVVAFLVLGLGAYALVIGIVNGKFEEIGLGLTLIVGGAIILVWKRR